MIVTTEPEPPQNVRLAYPDGTESAPLPLFYTGTVNEHGCHVWDVICPAPPAAGTAVKMDLLPGQTTIRFAFTEPE